MKSRLRIYFASVVSLLTVVTLIHPDWVHASIEQISELIQVRKLGSGSKYERSHQIHGAVALNLTARGQSYFKDDLADAIYRVSQTFSPKAINVNFGHLKDLQMKYDSPLDMKNLSPKLSQPFEDLKNEIHLWLNDKFLNGVNLNYPQPDLRLSELEYQVKYSKLAVRFLEANDPNSPKDTFRILFEIEVPNFQVSMHDLTVRDLQNSIFGTFGSKSPSLALNSNEQPNHEPFKISAQVAIQNGRNGLSAKISEISSNLENITFDLGYKPLILPTIEVKTNSHKYTINNATLNKYLDNNIPSLLKSFQHFALEYVKNELLEKTNSSVATTFSQGIGALDLMPPPGGPDLLPQADYLRYGLSLYSSERNGDLVSINMMGYAEDPKNISLNNEMSKAPVHVYPAQLSSVNQNNYDLALSLNENFLNQMLFISFKRGYFNDIPMGDKGGTHLRLASAPVVHFKDSEVRLSLHVATHMHGIATLAVKKDVEAKFDVLLRLEKNGHGGFRVLIVGTDVKSGVIEPQYIKILKRLVRRQFAGYLNKANKQYKAKPTVLAEHIPVPSELFGIPLVVDSGQPENSGNFVIYLSLDRDQIEFDKQDRRNP